MTLRFETLAPKNMPVNTYSLMTWEMKNNSTQTTTSNGIQCKKTSVEKGNKNCKSRK
jgi:hypothetical protein